MKDMNKIGSNIVFFSGQLKPEDIASLESTKEEIVNCRVKLAYTDKDFALRNFALSGLVDKTLIQSKI